MAITNYAQQAAAWGSGGDPNAAEFARQQEEARRRREAAREQELQAQSTQEESDIAVRALDPTLATREKYNAQAQQRQLEAFRSLIGGMGGGGDVPLTGAPGGIPFDEAGARGAAFARAKERTGQTSRAALDALRGVLSSSGRLGGQFEAEKTGQVIGGAAGDLGEFEREQLIQDLQRAGQISDREAAGALTRRGQDISLLQSRQSSLQGLLSALQSGGGLY